MVRHFSVQFNNGGCLKEEFAKEALSEAKAIKEGLSNLPPEKVIWDIENLSEEAPWGNEIGEHIKNVAMFYMTKNGLNLVDELVDNIDAIIQFGGNLEIISYDGTPPFFS